MTEKTIDQLDSELNEFRREEEELAANQQGERDRTEAVINRLKQKGSEDHKEFTAAVNSIFTKEELEFAIKYFSDDMNSVDKLNKQHEEFKKVTDAFRIISKNNSETLKMIDEKSAAVENARAAALARFAIAESIVSKCKLMLAEVK